MNMKFKDLLLIILAVSCLLCLSACAGQPQKNDFSFELINPALNVRCGEKADFAARLVNKTENEYLLQHGFPLITVYVYPDGEAPKVGVGTVLIETTIKPYENIDKSIHVKFDEPGEYILRSFCVFFGGAEFYYETEPVTIHVSE